jgi:hypothetical protein
VKENEKYKNVVILRLGEYYRVGLSNDDLKIVKFIRVSRHSYNFYLESEHKLLLNRNLHTNEKCDANNVIRINVYNKIVIINLQPFLVFEDNMIIITTLLKVIDYIGRLLHKFKLELLKC